MSITATNNPYPDSPDLSPTKLDKGGYDGNAETLDTKIDAILEEAILLINNTLVGSASVGSIVPTSVPPATGAVHAFATQAGTYTNWGGFIIPANTFAFISRSASLVFSISQTTLDVTGKVNVSDVINNLTSTETTKPLSAAQGKALNEKSEKIPFWAAEAYPIGTQRNYLGKDWYLPTTAALSTDIPGGSSKWVERLGGYASDSINDFKIDLNAGLNLVNNFDSNYIVGVVLNSTGGTNANAAPWKTTGYVKVNPSTIYTTNFNRYVAFYDKNKVHISTLESRPNLYFTTPSTAKFLRFDGISTILQMVEGQYTVFPSNVGSFEYIIDKQNNTIILANNITAKVKLEVLDIVIDNVVVEAEINTKNGILNPTLPLFWDERDGSPIVLLSAIPDYLKNMGLEYFVKITPTSGSLIVEKYLRATTGTGLVIPQQNQWVRWSYYVYSPNLDIDVLEPNRLRQLWLGGTMFVSTSATMRKVSSNVYFVYGVAQFTGNSTDKTHVWIENVFKKVSGAAFSNTDFIYISGIQMGYSNNKMFSLKDGILYDYKTLSALQNATTAIEKHHNNRDYNFAMLSGFLSKYEMREVDSFNQLSIVMVGDSIFGRQTPAEMSITQDTNGGTGNGYTTGHFPPNMWNRNVAFRLLESLQYSDSDVKYYNHVASEVVKNGTWTDRYPVGSDALRVATTESSSDNAVLSFTGATHAKVIFSSYYGTGTGINTNLAAAVSIDGGTTWVTPESLGLICSQPNTGTNGNYLTGTQPHKWFNLIWKGFTSSVSYKLKITNTAAVTFPLWGFETWSKPRINIIVAAEGGNTAPAQNNRWERFYSKYYNPALVIYEMPYLNDLGTGAITNFKGSATTVTIPSASPTINDFWYVTQTGTYANFSGLSLKVGQYVEWNGNSWAIGQTTLNEKLIYYKTENEAVLNKCSIIGVPLLTIITHESSGFYPSRPYIYQNGLTVMRNVVAKYGFASLDVNYYQISNGMASTIQADGTHLNDTGVSLYVNLLNELLNVSYSNRFVGTGASYVNKKKIGTGTGASTISFGYEFSKVPTVRIYGNSSIVITAKTQSGFTVTGSGSYDYEAFIE